MKAIITGATRGIGRAVALKLAKEGYKLALAARSLSDLEALKKELIRAGSPEVFTRSVDFNSKFEAKNFSEAIIKAWKDVDVIVNNVGIFQMGQIDKEEEGSLQRMLNVNLFAAYHTTLPFLEGMRKRKKGHIFNICSIISKEPRSNAPAYAISKYALQGFNDVLRKEMHQYGVKVTSVFPGSVNTSSWDGLDAPKQDFVQPEDVASSIMNALKAAHGSFIREIVINPIDPNF